MSEEEQVENKAGEQQQGEQANSKGDTDDNKLREPVIEAIKTVFDPEIPVNIYELGLVYNIAITEEGKAVITMTLTSPNCPAAEQIPADVQRQVTAVEGISETVVDIVWEPPWTQDMMSEETLLMMGLM